MSTGESEGSGADQIPLEKRTILGIIETWDAGEASGCRTSGRSRVLGPDLHFGFQKTRLCLRENRLWTFSPSCFAVHATTTDVCQSWNRSNQVRIRARQCLSEPPVVTYPREKSAPRARKQPSLPPAEFRGVVRGAAFAMSSRHANCSVVGCQSPRTGLFAVPAAEEQKRRWLRFIFKGRAPASVPGSLFVCANHFTADCFSSQNRAGLVNGSVPTIRDPPAAPEAQVSPAGSTPAVVGIRTRGTSSLRRRLRCVGPARRELGGPGENTWGRKPRAQVAGARSQADGAH